MMYTGGSRGAAARCFLFALLAGVCSLALYAQVDEDELEKGPGPVSFINYEGPYARIETRAQIRNIGYSQGLVIKGGADRASAGSRYFVIHSVSEPDGDRLDADIFGLGVDAGVDHIRNLRLIIQGYLEGAYDYSPQDAALLAEYITIYNAVFRGNWGYFQSRYKNPVLESLSPEQAGLSIRFDEWPGRTLILIPLAFGQAGSLSAVDTSSLTEPEVIDELRAQDDMGIEQRKEMVALKEREAEEAEERAAVERDAIIQEEKRIVQERQEAAQERQAIAQERERVQAEVDAGQTAPEEARQIEITLDGESAEKDRKDMELDQRDSALTARREAVQRTEDFAEQKTAEAQQERQDIARDQQTIIAREDGTPETQPRDGRGQQAPAQGGSGSGAQAAVAPAESAQSREAPGEGPGPSPAGILGMWIASAGSPLGRLVRVNPSTGEELKASAINTVNARALVQTGGKIIAVAGENRGNGAIRLVEISASTLEMVKQGDDDIHPQSLLWVNGASLYAIVSSGDGLYLAKFNTDLVREAQSSIAVHAYAAPLFQGNDIMIQRSDGSPAVLNMGDLSEKK